MPERVYDWLGAFAYEYFLEQAIIAVLLYSTPFWNNNWDHIVFGSAEFMYIWLLFIPWVILQYEHELDRFIDFGEDQMLQYFVLESVNNFFTYPYLSIWPILVFLDGIYKWSMFELYDMDGWRD